MKYIYRLEAYDNTVPCTQRMPLIGRDNYRTPGSARRQFVAIAEKNRGKLQPIEEHPDFGEMYNYGAVSLVIKKEPLR